MKRLIIGLASISVLAMLISGITGCGNNTGQAQTYMAQADRAYEEVKSKDLEVNTVQGPVFGAIVSTDPAKLLEAAPQLENIRKILAAYKASAEVALKDYKKIKGLSDVTEYKDYADLMEKVLDLRLETLAMGEGIINDVSNLIQQVQSGQQVDLATADKQILAKAQQAFSMRAESTKLETQAKAYQIKHKLSQ